MKAYEFAQQYYKRLADGENLDLVNSEVILDGEAGCYTCPMAFAERHDDRLSWKPKTITVTIPEPIPMPAKDGEKFYYAELCFKTMKERDDARRILNGGKDEA